MVKESIADPEETNQVGKHRTHAYTQSNIKLIEDIAGSVIIHAPFVHT